MAALTQNPHAMAAMANISQHYLWLASSLFFYCLTWSTAFLDGTH